LCQIRHKYRARQRPPKRVIRNDASFHRFRRFLEVSGHAPPGVPRGYIVTAPVPSSGVSPLCTRPAPGLVLVVVRPASRILQIANEAQVHPMVGAIALICIFTVLPSIGGTFITTVRSDLGNWMDRPLGKCSLYSNSRPRS
jgi:hypothetical protein